MDRLKANWQRNSVRLVCLILSFKCTSGTEDCKDADLLADKDLKVRWDGPSQRCSPAACGGTRLADIPDASGHVPPSLLCKMKLVDTASAQLCLKGKYIVLLGDSTMTDTMHDLVMLLSGLANRPEELEAYAYNATRQPWEQPTWIWLPVPGLLGGMKVEFFGSHRNMTLTIPSLDIVIRYRYTGHINIGQSGMGLETFFHADFQDELTCLLGAGFGCMRQPDVLLINSGLHDTNKPVAKTMMWLHELAKRLAAVREGGTHVLWRGNNALPQTHGLDVVSRHYMTVEGVPYVDTRDIMRYFEADIAAGCCTDDSLPGGPDVGAGLHIGAIAKYHNASLRLTVSSMATQAFLGHICGQPPGTLHAGAGAIQGECPHRVCSLDNLGTWERTVIIALMVLFWSTASALLYYITSDVSAQQ